MVKCFNIVRKLKKLMHFQRLHKIIIKILNHSFNHVEPDFTYRLDKIIRTTKIIEARVSSENHLRQLRLWEYRVNHPKRQGHTLTNSKESWPFWRYLWTYPQGRWSVKHGHLEWKRKEPTVCYGPIEVTPDKGSEE